MDTPRDLGQVEYWQMSLERSLARRGRHKRASVELHRLLGERDLVLDDALHDSTHYSQLRRRVAEHRLVPRPAVAVGGASAFTLLAVASLPGLLGSRGAPKDRIANAAKMRGRGRANKSATSPSLQPRSVSALTLAGNATPVALHTVSRRTAPKVLSVSESTRQMQQRVGVVADGDFGPITLRAVRAFQAKHGLVVDGIVGPDTRGALGLPAGPLLRANPIYFPKPVKPAHHGVRLAAKPAHDITRTRPAPKVMSIGATIRLMQERLGIPADGEFGPSTLRAVKAFQSRHGLIADGIVGPDTRAALGLPAGPVLRASPAYFPRPAAPAGRSMPTTTHHSSAPVHHSTSSTTTTTSTSGGMPAAVAEMIAAGNQIATRPYVYGGGHASFYSWGYDCSGSVSYVLHAAGLLSSPEDSTALESYGQPGPGRWVTIYANAGHAWMTIDGRRFDTVALAETGSRWSSTMAPTAGYVVRHPAGL